MTSERVKYRQAKPEYLHQPSTLSACKEKTAQQPVLIDNIVAAVIYRPGSLFGAILPRQRHFEWWRGKRVDSPKTLKSIHKFNFELQNITF